MALALTSFSQSRFEEEGSESESNEKEQVESKSKVAPSRAQSPRSDFWDRTRFGGYFGLSFGTLTYINVSPRMYYLATEKLWLGAGLTFIYSKDNSNYVAPPFDEQFVYGANFSAQYFLIGPLFLQAEYEPLSFERYDRDALTGQVVGENRVWINNLLLGGGISQQVGRGSVFLSVLYNVSWSNSFDSYYSSPWIFRVGGGF